MKKDYVDEMLFNYYKTMETPTNIENIAKNIPTQSIHKKKKYVWKISTVCAILLMICTITFGRDIYLYILDIFSKTHEGIATAIDNEYYAEINMEYVESNGTKLKIDYLLMDDFNLFLAFDTISDIDETIYREKINDMLITDENNNLIFCDNMEVYERYCEKRENDSMPSVRGYTDKGYGVERIETNVKQIKSLYKLYSSGYPRCKELNIEIHEIELTTKEETIKKQGIWKIKIALPEEFYSREFTYYNVKDGSDKEFNINIENIIVSNTQAIVKYNGTKEKYNATIEGVEERLDNLLSGTGNFYDEIWIENEKGKKFELSAINDGYGTTYSPDGTYKGELPFSLTKYDITDKIYLIITKDGKQYKINLER